MLKRFVIASIAVFFAWMILDLIIHSVLLGKTYEATADLWRPMEEMKTALMNMVRQIAAICFVAIYAYFIGAKSMGSGIKYGLLWGIGMGIGMGFGTYSVMPIPLSLGITWFIGTIVKAAVSGIITAAIVKEIKTEAQPEAA